MAITRPVPSVRRFATMLPLAFAGSCSRANIGHFQELGTFHAPNMHTLYPGVTHFVTAPESTMREPAAVLAFSRRYASQIGFLYRRLDPREALGSARIDLVAASYGTRVALEYLRRYPARVRDRVAPAPPGPPPRPGCGWSGR